jgi:ParB/RepB/Spo0J family partition protein
VSELKSIPIDLIDEPEVPVRALMDETALVELSEDIKLNGVIEPLIVSAHDGRYKIWAGHRRYKAAKMAWLPEVPCIVRDEAELPSDAVKLSENLCREDVSPAEIGWFVLQLVDKFQLSMPELCRRLRRSENWIQERVDLVQKDGEVAKAVAMRQINFAVAKELNKCADEAHRRYLLKLAIDHGCSARTILYQVQQWRDQQQATVAPPPAAGQPAEPAVVTTPATRCALCGVADAPQNMLPLFVHYYHWEPVKKFLRDSGIEVNS